MNNEIEALTKRIETLLAPINGTVTNFGQAMIISHRERSGNEPWKEWETTTYPVTIDSKHGEHDFIIEATNPDRSIIELIMDIRIPVEDIISVIQLSSLNNV